MRQNLLSLFGFHSKNMQWILLVMKPNFLMYFYDTHIQYVAFRPLNILSIERLKERLHNVNAWKF